MKILHGLTLILMFPGSALGRLNVQAPRGGTFQYNIVAGEPANLLPTPQTTMTNMEVLRWGCNHLFEQDLTENRWKPAIAKRWTFSKNHKQLNIVLRDDVFFHDGQKVTAEDVKFSIDIVRNPQAKADFILPYLEAIETITIKNSTNLQINFKNTYFGNLSLLGNQIFIIPKHIYDKPGVFENFQNQFICSGPYQFHSWSKGSNIVLKRFPKWFGYKSTDWKGFYNFEQIVFSFLTDSQEITKKANNNLIDFSELNWSTYSKVNIESGPSSKIIKMHVQTETPRNLVYLGFNFHNKILQSKSVRKALSLLMDRETFNQQYFFGLYEVAIGPFARRSDFANKSALATPFDPIEAKLVLKKDGWIPNPNDGVLEKLVNGQKLAMNFRLVYGNKFYEPIWKLYSEELRRAGIKLKVDFIDSALLWDILDEGRIDRENIDMWAAAWSAYEIEEDPTQIWHSSSSRIGGSNHGSYANSKVDKLIEKGRETIDDKQRAQTFREAGELIAADFPYIFMFNNKYSFYLNSKRVRKSQNSFRYGIGTETWWSTDIQQKDLNQ